MNFTVVIISFKGFHIIEKNIRAIGNENQIIIIENSLDKALKKKLESLYNNVKVVIPNNNLGFGKALNLGIELSKNDFVINMVPDAILSKEFFLNISSILNQFDDFSVLSPTYIDESVYKTHNLYNEEKEEVVKKKVSEFILKKVNDVDSRILIFNKKKFNTSRIMDEKIFMYFEYADLCLRLKKTNHKMYVIENLKFKLSDLVSHHKDYEKKIQINKSWHYCWSKFYFFRKHYNYFYAFKKTLPNLLRSIKYCFYYKFKKEEHKYALYKSELSGLINAYLLKKPNFRLDIN